MQNEEPTTVPEDSGVTVTTGPVMTNAQKRFYASEQCTDARHALERLVESHDYNTDSRFAAGNYHSFVERHLHYLSTHPLVNLDGYLSNLKLMTRLSSGRKQ